MQPLTIPKLEQLIERCPPLPLHRGGGNAMISLLNRDDISTAEIAEGLKQDRALVSRVLRTVNSAYYGLAEPVEDLEEAILYIGMEHLRRIALTSPVLDNPSQFVKDLPKETANEMWQHAVATAILTQEILKLANIHINEEVSYLAGLLHDIGYFVMASVAYNRFETLLGKKHESTEGLLHAEAALFGWNHAQIGSRYLQRMGLAPEAIDAVAHHHSHDAAKRQPALAAAILIAEESVRRVGMGNIPPRPKLSDDVWRDLPAWNTLFQTRQNEARATRNRVRRILPTLPDLIHGIA